MMKTRNWISTSISILTVVTTAALLFGPTAVLAMTDVPMLGLIPSLSEVVDDPPEKFAQSEPTDEAAPVTETLSDTSPRQAAPLPEQRPDRASHTVPREGATPITGGGSSGDSGTGTGDSGTTSSSTWTPEQVAATAQAVVNSWKARYPDILGDVTLQVTPLSNSGYARPASGIVAINANLGADPTSVVNHEVYHIYEWRTTGHTSG